MTVIPGQVVKEDGNGPRPFQSEVAHGVESTSVLTGVVAVVSNLISFELLPAGVTLVLAFVESFD